MRTPRRTDVISRIDTWTVPINLRRPHVMSFGSIPHATLVLVRVTSKSGTSGWGETTILGGPYWNEESAESVQAVLNQYLGPRLIGIAVDDSEKISAILGSVRRNYFARSAIDIALHDLRARILGVPVSVLLGGQTDLTLPVSWSIAGSDLRAELDELDEKIDSGHTIIKVKTGSLPIDEEIHRVESIREKAGSSISLRVDANQGWSRDSAGRAIRALEALHLDFIEQPLMSSDIEGLQRLQAVTSTPIAADESLERPDQASRLISTDSARVFILKLAKHAGYRDGLAIANLGQSNGIGSYLGCMIESSLGTAASLAFAAAGPPLTHGCELFGPSLLADDLVDEPIDLAGGEISLPTGPGLGVNVDVGKVERLATSQTTLGQ